MVSLHCEMIITIEPTLCSVQSSKVSVKSSALVFLEITHARDHLQFLYYLGPLDTLSSPIYFRNYSTRVELKLLITIDLAVIESTYKHMVFF